MAKLGLSLPKIEAKESKYRVLVKLSSLANKGMAIDEGLTRQMS
jgi:hypothetical protein